MSTTVIPSESAPSSPSRGPLALALDFFSFKNRYLVPFLVTVILVFGQVGYGVLESYSKMFLAVGGAMALELVLSRLILGRWPNLASAYITGNSVAMIVRSPAYWPFLMASWLSISSKYALRWRGRHLWNPSNLGISAVLFLAPGSAAALSVQWGNSVWAMVIVWAFGILAMWRLKRFHICATYAASFVALAFVRSMVTGESWVAQVAPITGPMYQLFIFFQITDPPTTVRSRNGRMLVAFLVALVEMFLRLNRVVNAPFYALCMVGPAAFAIDLWLRDRQARREATPAPAAA